MSFGLIFVWLVMLAKSCESDLASAAYYFPLEEKAPSVETLSDKTRFVDFIIGYITNGGGDEDDGCTPYWDGKVLIGGDHLEMIDRLHSKEPKHRIKLANEEEEEEDDDNVDDDDDEPDIDEVFNELNEVATIAISFGGPQETDLIDSCNNYRNLAKAFLSVINKYQITDIDIFMDESVMTQENMKKLYNTIRKVRNAYEFQLTISLVVPVEANVGIKSSIVENLKPFENQTDLIDCFMLKMFDLNSMSFSVVSETLRKIPDQLKAYSSVPTDMLYSVSGIVLTSGLSPDGKITFTQELAFNLMKVAKELTMSRVALYSINRDVSCPEGVDHKTFQPFCSGLKQNPFDFAEITEDFSYNDTEVEDRSTQSKPEFHLIVVFLIGFIALML